jgi:hypothetical protein
VKCESVKHAIKSFDSGTEFFHFPEFFQNFFRAAEHPGSPLPERVDLGVLEKSVSFCRDPMLDVTSIRRNDYRFLQTVSERYPSSAN